MAIQRALRPLEGIAQVEVDVPNKVITLTVKDDEALAQAEAVLEEIGYSAKRI